MNQSATTSHTPAEKQFLQQLRGQTHAAHESLETTTEATNLMNDAVTMQDYQRYLCIMYGVVKALEEEVYNASAHLLPDVHQRLKAHLMQQDLLAAGLTPAQVNNLPQLPLHNAFITDAGRWGALYVLEGSSLGGNVIFRHLAKKLPLTQQNGAAYFNAYAQATGTRWQTFLQHFTANAVSQQQTETIIAAANNMFERIRNWFIQYPS
jgi:heme oxygenase